ncbi:hypothetical protein [Dolosigranulum pigrum]|uniref:hypothetical protein n=1 Tax=Dolosigranulum pigrum TaxID=29394 RepID=UPI001AD8919D|nr:hypothetical protein [Dolosigranulum pigrum]QTJ35025.1 hypothetical protein FE322_06700 [Dolosigranulum pigrum]QTJ40190.1 hypothetical protein FE325_06630 [Dolosigranulum pigrum]QTJ48673.1 hypothetical protein FE330_06675 [Dolosigranulum pigrum]
MEFDVKTFKESFVERPIILSICFFIIGFFFRSGGWSSAVTWLNAVLIYYLITSIYVLIKYDVVFKEKESNGCSSGGDYNDQP